MKDPFYKAFPDGTEINAKKVLGAMVAGAVMASPVVLYHLREDLGFVKGKLKRKFNKSKTED